MSDFKPLKVTIHVDESSPVVMTGPIHLDALLASQMVWSCGDRGKHYGSLGDEPAKCIHLPLARMQYNSDSWFRASAVVPVGVNTVHHWVKRWDDKHEHLIDIGDSRKVTKTNGYFREYHVPMQIVSLSRLVFRCVGHRDKIRSLLKRLGAVGKKTSSGYGRIKHIDVDYIDDDIDSFALDYRSDDNRPIRNLPVSFCRHHNLQYDTIFRAPIEPPYWRVKESNTRDCALWY